MIGISEVAKDLMFLAPILEVLGINVGEMQQQAWGEFIPTQEVSDTYARFSDNALKNRGITDENLASKLPEIIEAYPPIQGNTEINIARKQYMLERTNVLANQVSNCLDLDSHVA